MPNSAAEVLLVILWMALFWMILGRVSWGREIALTKLQVQILFVIKVLVGIALAIFYELYYDNRSTSDAFRYFDDAKIIAATFWTDPATYFKVVFAVNMEQTQVIELVEQLNNWYKNHLHGVFNDNQTIIRFNALLLPVSLGYFHVHTVIIAFLSYTGFLALLRGFRKWFPYSSWFAIFVLLFPQLLFWTSAVLKEGLLFFAFGWFFFNVSQLYFKSWTKANFIGLILSLFACFIIKNYVLICLIPGLTLLLLSRIIPQLKLWYFGGICILVLLLFAVGLDGLSGSHRAHSIFQKQHDFINEATIRNAGSYFESFVLEPNWFSLIRNTPEALYNTLTRPSIFSTTSIITKVAAVENLFLIFILLLPFIRFRKPTKDQQLLLVFSSSFCLILFILIGLTTPVAGAIVRYKIPALPFLFASVYILWDSDYSINGLLKGLKLR